MPFWPVPVSKLLREVTRGKELDAFLVIAGPEDETQQAVVVANRIDHGHFETGPVGSLLFVRIETTLRKEN